MAFELRPYQRAAVDAAIAHVKKSLATCLLELCTGAGKSALVSEIARFFAEVAPSKRILCIAPSRELVMQNHYRYTVDYGYPASVYCASAGSKCLRHQVIFASPQTAIKQIEKIAHMGVSAIIIDEAHGITDTMRNLIEAVRNYELNGKRINEKVRVIGMTATPYRLGTGYIYAIDGTGETDRTNDEGCARDPYYSRLVYRVQAGELVEAGFLSRAVVGESSDHYDTQNLKTDSFGRFSAASVAEVFDKSTKTEAITAKILAMSADRMGVIIFAATINHAEEIAGYLPPEQTCVITGKTPKKERESLINLFKARQLKYLVNVAVLTTGFDAPHVDVVAIMRATESASLFQQMIGRGLRLHPEKESCLVLDYAENIERHGLQTDLFTPQIRTKKEGGEGVEIEITCPVCGYHSIAKRRCEPEYDGLKHDEFGNFLIPGTEDAIEFDDDGLPFKWHGEVMTITVTDYADKDDFGEGQNKILPMPAHYTRRCKNDRARIVDGMPQECDHRYTLKHCPECNAENDIAARQCVSCKARLVDPNEKLTRVAGDSVSIAVGESVIVDCMGIKCKPHVGATGKNSLRVTYHTTAGHITAYHTQKQSWIFRQMCYANFTQPESVDPDYANCADWSVPPKTVKIKKTEHDGFSRLEIKEVHYR